jgi:uncharacterized protein (DUF2249 family)
MKPLAKPTADGAKVIDLRFIPCPIKHGQILQRWYELTVGDYFILVNDHDPLPLHYQFKAEFPDAFTWEHLDNGPDSFRVKITKVRSAI